MRQVISRIRKRISDVVFHGRQRAMILIGTDRKDSIDSGYGDGGQNDLDSAAIDLVAGFYEDQTDVDLQNDKSRVYIAEKTDPDSYFGVNVGSSVEGEGAIVNISDNIYLKARNKIKILNEKVSIYISEDGTIEVVATEKATIKVGNASISVDKSGNIELNGSQGLDALVVTDLDQPVHIDPITGSPVRAFFERAPGTPLVNRRVKIK